MRYSAHYRENMFVGTLDGERLQEQRLDMGLKQSEVGRLIGRSEQMISAYELGTSSPTVATLIQLAEIYDVSLDYLCGLTDKERTFRDEGYIDLPPDSPPELREEMLRHLDTLRYKYGMKKPVESTLVK